ncbi:MAG TPA: HEAT repeat domain-containing protein [Phycisphaerae bacterium]|nr:HEAT repeat domain-containing protein [Phycisphaerae bacterium]
MLSRTHFYTSLALMACVLLQVSCTATPTAAPSWREGLPPTSEIPAEATPEVRQLIESLCRAMSDYKAAGSDQWVVVILMSVMAEDLGSRGEDAAPAIPWLMGLLVECQRLRIGFETQENVDLGSKADFAWFKPLKIDCDHECPWAAEEWGEEYSGVRGVEDPDFEAARALVRIGKPAIAPLLRAAQMDPEFWLVRARAIEALGYLREPSAIGIVRQSLKDAHPVVRRAAAEALARLSAATPA